ncbi:MAG TPA: serine/threonine-protein kinase [Acidimicrobiales bacterium]
MRYETIARLGRGGMGTVDLARDPEGNRVALKRLTLHGSANDIYRARQRLLREAEVLRRLNHPNVVRLLDVVDEGDEIVLVMPYLPGGNLAERVSQHGPAPADEVERQARHLFAALSQAHALGIVHRDIKPANILFDENGAPCLVDFGVAHSWDQTHGLTVSGMVVGTPGFMSPEQARGETVTPASDVFSLGATLLYAATGEGPFGPGDPGLLMVRAASGKVERVPRHLPISLRRLLRSTLDPRPERRPTAAALATAPPGWVLPGTSSRGGTVAALVAAFAAAIAIGGGAAMLTDDGGGGGNDEAATTAGPGSTNADGAVPPGIQDCAPGFADYDGDPVNGCEAVDDDLDGATLVDSLEGAIVPADDTDVFPVDLSRVAPGCEGMVRFTLEVPEGMELELTVRGDGARLGAASGIATEPAVVEIGAERCDDRGRLVELEAEVRPVGSARVGAPYRLSVERLR